MVKLRRPIGILTALAALSSLSLLAGCSGSNNDDPIEGDEPALTEAKILSKGVSYPSGLAAAGNYIYFGANHFVASGDPELDQEMAYWEGKYSRVAITGGKSQLVDEIGPVSRVRVAGSKLYYTMSNGCWVSALSTTTDKPKPESIYSDDQCDGEGNGALSGFDIAGDKLIVVREGGEILAGGLDGKNVKKLGEVKDAKWGDVVDMFAIADDSVFIITQDHPTIGADKGSPSALHKVALAGGAEKKLFEIGARAQNLISDGKNLYWSEDTKLMALPRGAKAPVTVADTFGAIIDLATDGTNVFVADSKRGSVYEVANALDPAHAKPKKLVAAKGVQSIIVSNGAIYFGTQVIENKKFAGIIGAVSIPK